MEETEAVVALEDGSLFYGRTSGCKGTVCGEVVFNTSMTGYQEICTDPSYANQIVLFTTSHVGNVGINKDDDESDRPWAKGIIAREISKTTSSWRSEKSFLEFLSEHKVPWIEGIDTRKLTRHLRQNGTKNGCIMAGNINAELAVSLARKHVQPEGLDVFSKKPSRWHETGFLDCACLPSKKDAPKIFVLDFGVKRNILRTLTRLGCEVFVVPNTMSAAEVLSLAPDGIILSNGPGNPASIGEGIEEIRKMVFSGIPVLGICLGCQLIALAAGAQTKKMKFGHHGVNHPVCDVKKETVFITSQNHNFVVDETSLPCDLEVAHVSLFDGSVQGIRSKNYPVIGFQGHPEGSPGPQDIVELLEQFLEDEACKFPSNVEFACATHHTTLPFS